MDPIEHQTGPTDHTGHADLDVDPKDRASNGMDNMGHADHGRDHNGHANHGVDHTGHEILFRNRFWICLLLSIPVLLYSPTIQRWFDFSMPEFAGSQWITPVFATIVFFVGGVPFIRMAVPEIRNRKPGMMTLITLAISVAYLYSIAALALADVIRPESRQAVARLHEMDIEVAMLTGDSKDVAATVARELDIDTYFAQVLPEHKDEKVAELQGQGKKVVMVGDGVNDAPALTRADIGVAIGSGTDVAVESADIILVRSNPMDVVKMIELSQATRKKMVENLWWAAGYNIVFIPLAAFTLFITPAIGALFMSLSTVIVAINAQTLRRAELG